jgi:hypothetical protein
MALSLSGKPVFSTTLGKQKDSTKGFIIHCRVHFVLLVEFDCINFSYRPFYRSDEISNDSLNPEALREFETEQICLLCLVRDIALT